MSDEPTHIFDRRYRAVTFAILTLVALSAFEGLAVVAALPGITRDLEHVELLPWVATSYLLCSGVATVAAGGLVDRLGVTPVFRASVVLFLAGSAICGLAPTMTVMVLGRALQGIGGGAVNAVGLTAVGLVFPRHLTARAFAANANVWGIMSVAGPGIAAALLTFASWRWIFLVNLPICSAALIIGWRVLPTRRDGAPSGPLPVFDLVTLTAFSILVLVAIDRLDGWSIPAAFAALLLGGFLTRRSRGRETALIRPKHVLDAPLGPLGWGIAALLVGSIGTQTYVPLFVIGARGVGPALAAWSVVFLVLGWTTGANLSSRLLQTMDAVRLVPRGGALVPLALVAIGAAVLTGMPLPAIFVPLIVTGMGCGLSTNAAITLVRERSEDAELGRATAAHQFVRNLGFAAGNALVGAVMLHLIGREVGDVDKLRHAIGEASSGLDLAAPIEQAFGTAVLCAAAVSALGLVPLFRLRRAS